MVCLLEVLRGEVELIVAVLAGGHSSVSVRGCGLWCVNVWIACVSTQVG